MKTGKTLQELAVEIERQQKTKKDYIAETTAMVVHTNPGTDNVQLRVGENLNFGVNEIAHEQIAEHTGIPKKYYDRMRKEHPQLLANNINEWFNKYPAPRMVRTLDGNARALLSPSYQTFDNYDFASATLPILQARRLTVVSCEVTDRRLYIKAIDEKLFRDVPIGYKMGDGSHQIFDTCAPVVCLSNSEVGFGRLVVDTGVYTRACTNLCMWANGGMKKTHVGAKHKLADGLDVAELEEIMSADTKRKTLEALWGQVKDVVSAAFDEKVIAKRIEKLEHTAKNKIGGKVEKVVEVVAKAMDFTQVEQESILKHLIEGGSLTQYGLHAAVTRAAQDVETYDRATELEYAGGKIIELTGADWTRLAEAA